MHGDVGDKQVSNKHSKWPSKWPLICESFGNKQPHCKLLVTSRHIVCTL